MASIIHENPCNSEAKNQGGGGTPDQKMILDKSLDQYVYLQTQRLDEDEEKLKV